MASTVLHIGAHPDDEDIGLLSYLSNKYAIRAVYWSATRGEGGQNKIGRYSGELLGIYRTWESEKARMEDGGESLFGPFYDFGYCKSSEDAFLKWGKENVVREIVRAIRLVKPDIIVSRWKGVAADFHGHHQAIGLTTLEAFDAAGDPTKFQELGESGLSPWEPLKFYYSTDNSGGDYSAGGALNLFGNKNSELETRGFLRINTGEFDYVKGKTYQELAWSAYNQHQTQGMGLAPAQGDFFYYFYLLKDHLNLSDEETGLFDGLDYKLTGLLNRLDNSSNEMRNQLGKAVNLVEEALEIFRPDMPHRISSLLLNALDCLLEVCHSLKNKNKSREKAILDYLTNKISDFNKVIASCLGLKIESLANHYKVTPGQEFIITNKLWNHSGVKIDKIAFSIKAHSDWSMHNLSQESWDSVEGTLYSTDYRVKVSETTSFSVPYWLSEPRQSFIYSWPSNGSCCLPFGDHDITASCDIIINGTSLTLFCPTINRDSFSGGYRELPVTTIPPISLKPKKGEEYLPINEKIIYLDIIVSVHNNTKDNISGQLTLELPNGWSGKPERIDINLIGESATQSGKFSIEIPANVQESNYSIPCKFRHKSREYCESIDYVRMGNPGIPGLPNASNCIKECIIISPSNVNIDLIKAKFVTDLKYGYVRGIKEDITQSMLHFNVDFSILSDEDIGYIDLYQFDSIVIGPNAYLLREEMSKHSSRFLNYVKNGGTLLVLFQGYGYQGKNYTPYPFKYNQPHDRVTNETAKVSILDLDNVLLKFPNQIGIGDFSNWSYDRGMYFWGEWDKHYQPILSSADIGEEQLNGGWLTCQYGRGNFTYLGYSLFKQIPAGVSGAFRLFANLLGLPSARLNERVSFLKQTPLFSEVSHEQLEPIAKLMSEKWSNEGEEIGRQGDEGTECYMIYRGSVDIIKNKNGEETIIATVGKGECIGEMAILGNSRRVATMRAREDTQLLVIKKDHFRAFLYESPKMAVHMMDIILSRVGP